MVKTGSSIVVCAALLLGFCSAQEKHLTVKVANPSNLARESETIAIPWDSLKAILSAGKSESLIVNEAGTRNELVSQLIDDDLDGTPDHFIFQSSFKPLESKSFVVTASSKDRQPFASMVDARYVEPREDLAWENDHIAFRMYGPALAAEVNNGIDVWTKRVRYLIVKKWYDGEEQTPKIVYHVDHGEGADFFDVGRSLGCGGTGIWFQGKVYQPGVFSSYKIISTGPIRASFELSYDKWNVKGRTFKETKKISLDAGQNLNHIEVTFKGDTVAERIALACGLVKRRNTTFYKDEEKSRMSLWGQTNDSLANGYLGTGVVFATEEFMGWAEDSSQYIALGKTKSGSTFTYYAGAGWTRSGDFKSAEEWNSYLDCFAANVRSPLQMTIVREQ